MNDLIVENKEIAEYKNNNEISKLDIKDIDTTGWKASDYQTIIEANLSIDKRNNENKLALNQERFEFNKVNAFIELSSLIKSRINSYGKFNYANIDDILTPIKKVLTRYYLSIQFTTTLIEGRTFARAIVSGFGNSISYDVEIINDVEKTKGQKQLHLMQGLGSAHTYACKYAILRLVGASFADEKDLDDEYPNNGQKEPAKQKPSIYDLVNRFNSKKEEEKKADFDKTIKWLENHYSSEDVEIFKKEVNQNDFIEKTIEAVNEAKKDETSPELGLDLF